MPFARRVTAALIPTLPTLTKWRTASSPLHCRYATRPTSIVRVFPSTAIPTPSSKRDGIPYVRPKSMPVPSGMVASSVAAPARMSPSTVSLIVPSPPTATTRPAPSRAACSASVEMWPGPVESSVSPLRPRPAARCASSGQRRPVTPLSDAGLTKKAGPLMVGGDGRERDTRHPVDRRAELVVGDPLELALDDDVADGEEAARLHLSQGAEREEDRSLHLDGEDAPVRPALVLLAVGVVEDVARDDRADVHRLAELLRRVDRAVDQLPVGGGAMRLPHVGLHRSVLRHRGQRDNQVAE